jgi:hypothetical protein
MKRILMVLFVTTSSVAQEQVLSGDQQFPLLRELRWGMTRAEVVAACAARGVSVSEDDSSITLDAALFGEPTKTTMRLKGTTKRLGQVDIRFIDRSQALADTLTRRLTRFTGDSPMKVEKEKSVLLFTLRMEISVWETKTERLTLVVGKKGSSIFEIKLLVLPAKGQSEKR